MVKTNWRRLFKEADKRKRLKILARPHFYLTSHRDNYTDKYLKELHYRINKIFFSRYGKH